MGHGAARHRVARAKRCAGSTPARHSTSRSSTCTCRRWTASSWRGEIRARRPTLPLVLFSSLGRREAGDADGLFGAYLAKPCASRSCSTRWWACWRTTPAPKAGAAPAKAAARSRRWRRAIRCASCWPRTTSSTRSSRCGCCSRWATAPTSRRNGIEAIESRGAADLRRGADGRADAGDGRARGRRAGSPRAGQPASARASSR